ncbi:MAG: hypothetical protein JW952_07715 [Candidatus Eisenbacteria bacterium]|nr:hypothetical protein [Candidatus Eisenbacteria bacterium]
MNARKKFFDSQDERPNRKKRVIREVEDEKDWLDELDVEDDFEEELSDDFAEEEDSDEDYE